MGPSSDSEALTVPGAESGCLQNLLAEQHRSSPFISLTLVFLTCKMVKKYPVCVERIKFLIASQVNYSLCSGRLSTMHFLITNRVTGATNKYWREGFSTSLLKVNKKSSQFMFIWLFSWQMCMTIQYSVLKKIVMASCLSKKNVPRDYQSVLSGTIIGHSQTHPLNLSPRLYSPSTQSFRTRWGSL